MTIPYISFNQYLRQRYGSRTQRIPLHLGLTCPNRDGMLGTEGCLYCDAHGSAAPWLDPALPVAEQLAQGIARLKPETRVIAYFQPFSNTYGDPGRITTAWQDVAAHPCVVSLMIGTRPDTLNELLLEKLAVLNRTLDVWVELGLQSANNATLQRIRRGHNVAVFDSAVALCRKHGLSVAAHVIVGLPGEGEAESIATAEHLAALGIDGIKIHSLHVLKGTGMEKLWRDGQYQPLAMETYCATVRKMVELLPAKTVVMRLTGEGPPDRVLAPRWCLDKNTVLRCLREAGCIAAENRKGP